MRDRAYKDIPSLETIFKQLEPIRLRRMFLWQESVEIGRLLLGKSFRTEREAIDAVKDYYMSPDLQQSPPVCECLPPRDLRWHKVDQGEAVTWSYDPSRQTFANAGITLRKVFTTVERLCGIKFEETGQRDSDIHVTWDDLDGAGGTLGVTYVPGSGERMAACGPLCGDIVFDRAEQWSQGGLFETVCAHEVGHALGLPHTNNREDLMYPQLIAIRGFQAGDIAELLKRYPMEPVT